MLCLVAGKPIIRARASASGTANQFALRHL